MEQAIRQWNPGAPVFRAWVEPKAWVENRSGREYAIAERPFDRAGGLLRPGKSTVVPAALWNAWESNVPTGWSSTITTATALMKCKRLAQSASAKGAQALVTTEKDAVNLCDDCDDLAIRCRCSG